MSNGRYIIIPRLRGQQLKKVDQLDGWLRDGSQPLTWNRSANGNKLAPK